MSYTFSSLWQSPQITTLSSNPTSSSAQLVIPANTLSYGVYEFIFQVTATITSSNIVLASNIQSVYIEIIPTGLAVFAIANGVSGFVIGYQQTYTLSPGLFTIDFDYIVSPSSLNFTFYCSTVMLNGLNSFSTTSNSYDLMTYKMNTSLPMNSNQTCFPSNGNFI